MSAAPVLRGPAIEALETALERHGSRRVRQSWTCPAHDDRNPSLSVTERDGKVLVHCFAGCDAAAVMDALGLGMEDLFDQPIAKERSAVPVSLAVAPERRVAVYQYADRSGEILSSKSRFERVDAGVRRKRFTWDRGNPHVLYRLPEVVEADHVWLSEGEKAADRLAAMLPPGHVATCAPVTGWEQAFTEQLHGKSVSIIVDRDDEGVKQARAAFDSLSAAGVSVQCVQSAVTAPKADAFDHLEAGYDLDAFVPFSFPAAGGYSLLAFDEIKPSPDDDYLIKSLISRRTTNALIGAPGTSKTFLALDLSIAIASGTPWRGIRTKRGRVVYIAAEGASGIQNRLTAMKMRLALGDARSVLFHLVPDVVRLTADSKDVDRLIASIRDTLGGEPVDLVVIDTLSRAISGRDENSSADMTAAIAAADRIRTEIGAAILLVHHSGKDESRGARGHSSLKAALDSEIEVRKLGEVFEVSVTKSRDYEAGRKFFHRLEPVEIRIDADGEPVVSCIVRPTESGQSGSKSQLNKNEQRTHEGIRALLAVADGSNLSAPEAVLKADLRDWVEVNCDIPRKLRRGVVSKGLTGLKSKGLVEFEGERVFLLGDE